ncbi:aspartic peptidase domain-containing protein [Mycena crocata]|nr:aspartic peptidase domain-containing protein [Mycena crocata]
MRLVAALPALWLFLLAHPWLAAANGRDQQPSHHPWDDDPDDDINNNRNLRYTASLKMNGKIINVMLDTGSTDLWLNPPGGVGPFEDTGVDHRISYGEGKTFINGSIGLGDMEIAGHRIPRQAFINMTQNVGLNECGSGICGLVGLGFDSPTQGIAHSLSTAGIDPSVGKSVLSSIFDQSPTPSQNRFFAISLSRLGDENGSADASINIGEYDSDYAAVQYEAKRPVHPPTAKSWRLLSDGITLNGVMVPWPVRSTNTSAGLKNLVLLDTGTTNILMRPDMRDSIYSKIPGAVLAKNSSLRNAYWSSDRDVWVVPCNASLDLSAIFGGQPYPLHPLDMTQMYTSVGPNGVNYTVCVGSITNGGTITSGSTDALFGDTFLRNVYTVFSYGDEQTTPFVQFLSQTKMWESQQDFAVVRKELLANGPPEIAPADLVRIFDGHSSGSSSGGSPSSGSSSGGSSSGGSSSGGSSSSSGSSSGNCPSSPSGSARLNLLNGDDSDSATSSSALDKYSQIIIILLGANLVCVLVLIALGVTSFVRNRTAGLARGPSPKYVSVKAKDDVLLRSSFSEERPYSDRETQ